MTTPKAIYKIVPQIVEGEIIYWVKQWIASSGDALRYKDGVWKVIQPGGFDFFGSMGHAEAQLRIHADKQGVLEAISVRFFDAKGKHISYKGE